MTSMSGGYAAKNGSNVATNQTSNLGVSNSKLTINTFYP